MWRRPPGMLIALLLFATSCLGTLPHDREAEAVARLPAARLALPVRTSRPYWLLRAESGWVGGHEIDYGGGADDRGRTILRVARFRTTVQAASAFARLTPAYMRQLWPDRMAAEPHAARLPGLAAGESVRVTEYPLRVDLRSDDAGKALTVQLVAVRAGCLVIVIDSIGIPRDELAQLITLLIDAPGAGTTPGQVPPALPHVPGWGARRERRAVAPADRW